MTVSTQLRTVSFTGGVTPQTVFNLPFKFYDADTIFASIDGFDIAQGVDFTVGGNGETLAGTLTLAVALAQDAVLYVERTVPYLQEVDLQGQGSFLPETHEDALDILEFQIQQLVDGVGLTALLYATLIYDLHSFYLDTPADGTVLGRWTISRTVVFPPNLAGSRGTATVAAAASTVLSVKKNGVEVGTVTFGVGATVASVASAGFTVVAGDVVSLAAPTPADLNLEAISVVLVGQRVA